MIKQLACYHSMLPILRLRKNYLWYQPNPVHLTEQLDGFVVIGYCSSPILAHCQVTKGNQKLLLRPIQQHQQHHEKWRKT